LDIFSLAPGVEARFTIPVKIPMYLTGKLFYGPEILTFGDAGNMYDFEARYEIGFFQRTIGFIGYRVLHYDVKRSNNPDVIDDIYVGVRISF
jgi:hypothetical protein